MLCFEHTAQELVYVQHIYRSYYTPILSILGGSKTKLQTHEHMNIKKWSKSDRNIMFDFCHICNILIPMSTPAICTCYYGNTMVVRVRLAVIEGKKSES